MTIITPTSTSPSEQDLARLADEPGVEYAGGRIVEKGMSIDSARIEARIAHFLIAAANAENATVFSQSMNYRGDGSVALLHAHDEITGEAALPNLRCKVGAFFTAPI